MSSSTDSLKKKVCVTVFLDELFEEVLEDDWRELKQVNEVAESEVKIAEKPYSEPSRTDLTDDEKIRISSNAEEPKQLHVQVRPRKYRRESKFSKNHCRSFESELTRYDYGSCYKRKSACMEHIVESTASESDFVLDEFLKLDKWKVENRSSSSNPSEFELKEGSFRPTNPILSSVTILRSSELKIKKKKSSVSSCNKSTQFNGADHGGSEIEGQPDDDRHVENKEQKAVTDAYLPWKETQKQIHLILTRSKHRERETCEGDYLHLYHLRSVLEGCVKEIASSKSSFADFDLNSSMDFNKIDLLDSYTLVFPHDNPKSGTRRSSDEFEKSSRNDGFESDLSEAGCTHSNAGFSLRSYQEDALVSCTLRLRCEEKSPEKSGNSDANPSSDNFEPGTESSFESMKSKTSLKADLFYKTVFDLARETALGAELKAEQEKAMEETKTEGDFPVKLNRSPLAPEGRNKNFAEGDTLEECLNQDSRLILDIKAKEKVIVCDEILDRVTEPKVVPNEIIVNRADIELGSQENAKKQAEIVTPPRQSLLVSEEIAELFFKRNNVGVADGNVADVESTMVFAESENFCDDEEFSAGGLGCSFKREPLEDVCVFEIEDELSGSRVLRRTKTADALEDERNLSAEIVVVCENIGNDDEIRLEAWQNGTSVLRSHTEMRRCYLKDSKDSTMYLIEVPLNFVRGKRKEREHVRLIKRLKSD